MCCPRTLRTALTYYLFTLSTQSITIEYTGHYGVTFSALLRQSQPGHSPSFESTLHIYSSCFNIPSTFTKLVGISTTRWVYATPPNIGPTLKLQQLNNCCRSNVGPTITHQRWILSYEANERPIHDCRV